MRFRKRYGGILGIIIAIYLFGFHPDKSYMSCQDSICTITAKSAIGKTVSKRTLDISIVKSFYLNKDYISSHRSNYKYYIYARTHKGQVFRFFENYTRSLSRANSGLQFLNEAIQNPPVNIDMEY